MIDRIKRALWHLFGYRRQEADLWQATFGDGFQRCGDANSAAWHADRATLRFRQSFGLDL